MTVTKTGDSAMPTAKDAFATSVADATSAGPDLLKQADALNRMQDLLGIDAAGLPGTVRTRFNRLTDIYLPSDTCLLQLRKGLNRGRLGGAPARILTRGDSTTYGVLSGNNPNSLAVQTFAWPHRARQILNLSKALGGTVRELIHLTDSRFTLGSGWAGSPAAGTGGGSGTLTFVGDRPCNAFDITIHRGGNAPSITATVDGGSPVTVTLAHTNNTSATYRVSAGSVATHTLVLTLPASGTIGIFGLEQVDTTAPDVASIAQIGYSGQLLTTGLNPAVTTVGSNMSQLLEQLPDAVILRMGVNDMRFSADPTVGSNVTAYRTALDQFAAAIRAINADPVFMVFPSYNSNTTLPTTYESRLWQQAIYDSAEANNVAVLDLQRRWGYGTPPTTNYATTPAAASAMYDGTHDTLVGYFDVGKMVATFLGDL